MKRAPTFHLGDLLSISTGRLLAPTGIAGVCAILNHLTDDDLMTHQLPIACEAMQPELADQHPWLGQVEVPEGLDHVTVPAWLVEAVAKWGERHEVRPAPRAWGQHDPIRDFHNQWPDTPVVAVVSPAGPASSTEATA